MTSNNTEAPAVNPLRLALDPKYKHNRVVPMGQFYTDPATKVKQELYLPMVIMTSNEEAQVEAAAYDDTLRLFKGKPPKKDEPSSWDAQLDAQRACWTVYTTCRIPNDLNQKYFESKHHVEEIYSWDELGTLMAHYLTVRMTQPQYKDVDLSDPAALQNMIEKVKKLGEDSDFFLNGLTTHAVNQFMKFLVRERESYLKSSG